MPEPILIVDICIRHPETNKFLVVTNKRYGGFTTPGGKIDKDEEPRLAAARELMEETGLEVRNLQYVGDFEFVWDLEGHESKLLVVYQFLSDLDGQKPREVEKGTRPFWVEREELLHPPCLAPVSYGWLFGKMDW